MRILIVEDNESIAEGIKCYLEKNGHNVIIKNNIVKTEETLKINLFDFIILDILLPDGSGLELCKKIKDTLDIPVIFLTAKDMEVDIIYGLEIGADDYIVKPFRMGELMARINSVLRRYKNTSVIEKFEKIKFDIDSKQIYNEDKKIDFTKLEWKILIILLNAKGKIVSREKLINLIYNESGNYINDNTLSVYIKRMRKKLGDNLENPRIIKTIRGVGYKIEGADNK